MARKSGYGSMGLPDPRDPDEVMEAAEPELREGPLGLPFLAPSGAPELPGERDGSGGGR